MPWLSKGTLKAKDLKQTGTVLFRHVLQICMAALSALPEKKTRHLTRKVMVGLLSDVKVISELLLLGSSQSM